MSTSLSEVTLRLACQLSPKAELSVSPGRGCCHNNRALLAAYGCLSPGCVQQTSLCLLPGMETSLSCLSVPQALALPPEALPARTCPGLGVVQPPPFHQP